MGADFRDYAGGFLNLPQINNLVSAANALPLAAVQECRAYSFTATASANHVTVKSMIAVKVRSAKPSEESIPALRRREGNAPSLYYSWSKQFLDVGNGLLTP